MKVSLVPRRRLAVSTLSLVMVSLACSGPEKERCEANEPDECRGNVVFQCEVSRTVDEDSDFTFWYEGVDCGNEGNVCRSGQCVHSDAPCTSEQESRCFNERIARCVDGLVATGSTSCEPYGPDSECMEVTDDAGARAVCAVEPGPCVEDRCEGNTAFYCHDGYMREHHECADGCMISALGRALCTEQ